METLTQRARRALDALTGADALPAGADAPPEPATSYDAVGALLAFACAAASLALAGLLLFVGLWPLAAVFAVLGVFTTCALPSMRATTRLALGAARARPVAALYAAGAAAPLALWPLVGSLPATLAVLGCALLLVAARLAQRLRPRRAAE